MGLASGLGDWVPQGEEHLYYPGDADLTQDEGFLESVPKSTNTGATHANGAKSNSYRAVAGDQDVDLDVVDTGLTYSADANYIISATSTSARRSPASPLTACGRRSCSPAP